MTKTAAAESVSQRKAALREVALDCLRRLAEGEPILDESIQQAHPDLMPELAHELTKLRRIHAAGQLVAQSPGGLPVDATSPPAAVLRIRCPECHTPAEIVAESDLSSLTCGSCGGQFSLVGADDDTHSTALPPKVGHFELLEQIGVGGFGTVWKAYDGELDRLVAIKLPRRGQLDAGEAEQFFREARAAAQLRHPNIVSVHEVGRDGDRVYIVSDLVEGPSLAQWLADERMSAREAAALCRKIAAALAHAHAAGVVHRDLKPANVLLDASGEPHLTDFGLARRRMHETTVTVDGQFLGTPAYMSPEQARGESHTADERSDVYSLGVILYELLTGEVPFRGNPANLLHQIVHEEPQSPRAVNRNIPRDLETITLKCLEKDPARRYATAKDLAEDLGRFLRSEPIVARPVSRAERAWRWCRRNPRTAGLSATVAALLVVVAGVTTYSSIHSHAAASEARWQQYLSDMHAAMQLWDEGSTGEVMNLLERHRPTAGAEDLRAFEWYYLWRQVRSASGVPVLQHDSAVVAVCVSPNGKLLAAGDEAGVLTLWDLAARRILTTREGDGGGLRSVAFSPDGETIATASSNGTVKLWPADGAGEPRVFEGHRGQIPSLTFSPDGNRLATGSEDGTAVIWNLTTGERQHVLGGYKEPVALVVWKDSHRLLAAGREGLIREWNADTGQPLDNLAQLPPRIGMGALLPDKSTLAVACYDGAIRLLDANEGTLLDTLVAHAPGTLDIKLAFSPNGRMLASGGRDNNVYVFDMAARKNHLAARNDRVLRGHSLAVWSLVFTPDGDWLASASADRTVRIWNVTTTLGEANSTLVGHSMYVLDVAFDRNGKWLASAGAENTVRIWDIETGEVRYALDGGTYWMTSLSTSPRDPLVAGACWDGRLTVWNAETGDTVWTHQAADRNWQTLAFSPDGQVLMAVGVDGIFTSYDSQTGAIMGSFSRSLAGGIAFSPDGEQLAVTCENGSIKLLDPRTGEELRVLDGHRETAYTLKFAPDGRFLASANADSEICIWELVSGRVLHTLRHGAEVNDIAFSPEGRVLASAGSDNHIRLWDVARGDQRAVLAGHKHWVESVAFSPDGSILASASDDRTIRLWRAARKN